jgi:hypothetical protein
MLIITLTISASLLTLSCGVYELLKAKAYSTRTDGDFRVFIMLGTLKTDPNA